jgi:DNA helicase II / ATP-dependent DNA helicase PcrA
MFKLPIVNDDDIAGACIEMGLPATAFCGLDGKDPRAEVLKRMDTIDIEACPGSGKTTLLVAKLAILANKWNDARQGLCVLSHTNAARNEIASRINKCAAGNAVLRYPHFIGTIHGLVNEFLAIPWLRSNGYLVKVVDSELVQKIRWSRLEYKTRYYLERQHLDHTCMTYDRVDFGGGPKSRLGEQTQTCINLAKICKDTSNEGFFCYDEMFVWAKHLLDTFPEAVPAIRQRFPLVIVDEAQDNSEMQSALLYRLFCEGNNPVIRQRFGDSNQAIYKNAEQDESATTDAFPSGEILNLPNSFRFGQVIADLADPVAPTPQGMIGKGPSIDDRRNAIFLFDELSILNVLPAYAKHLITSFSSDQLISNEFTAVAGVHASPKTDKLPRSLVHYAPNYEPEQVKQDPRHKSFLEYLAAGVKAAQKTKMSSLLVEKVATAIQHLSHLCTNDVFQKSSNSHCLILDKLQFDAESRSDYLGLIRDLVVCVGEISAADWVKKFSPRVAHLAQKLSGTTATPLSTACRTFLAWGTFLASVDSLTEAVPESNVFSYPTAEPILRIRLGSIHSVKGETHAATLVMDTYFHKHHLSELKPWLLGVKKGKGNQGSRMIGRLKLHYVAMTRPSHLLCLAMRRNELSDVEISTLESRGWKVIHCENSTDT